MSRKRTSSRRKPVIVLLRFTGAAGGTAYMYPGGVLHVGDAIEVNLNEEHWKVLLLTGNAEVVW